MIIFVKTDTFQLPLLRSNDHKRNFFKGKNLIYSTEVKLSTQDHTKIITGAETEGVHLSNIDNRYTAPKLRTKIGKIGKKVESYFNPSKMKI